MEVFLFQSFHSLLGFEVYLYSNSTENRRDGDKVVEVFKLMNYQWEI